MFSGEFRNQDVGATLTMMQSQIMALQNQIAALTTQLGTTMTQLGTTMTALSDANAKLAKIGVTVQHWGLNTCPSPSKLGNRRAGRCV